LNQKVVKTSLSPGILLLDFIRYQQNLTGTKIGCREGDCGACTILIGEIKNGKLFYTSATSCLMAIGYAHGKHIVTIEGINLEGLNAIQQAFADEGATQCGFCTPGFIVSLAGFCINSENTSYDKAIDSVNGNICRCTGYKSIERAAQIVSAVMSQRKAKPALQYAVDNKIIPDYFLGIEEKLLLIENRNEKTTDTKLKLLGGGTDLYVQIHDQMPYQNIEFLAGRKELKGIIKKENICMMGAAVTVTDIAESPVFIEYFPGLLKYIRLISSTQIRNMATVGGNFINASPIGDLTIFFLALDAQLVLNNGTASRDVSLRSFYKGYKLMDKDPGEIIEIIYFKLPAHDHLFNFEKVSKRTCLDIASVNTAIYLAMNGNVIRSAGLSAGGVGPVPAYLFKSSKYLEGKIISSEMIQGLINIVQDEIVPISDVRGSEEYKRLLLAQLIKAHFITLFPSLPLLKLIGLPA